MLIFYKGECKERTVYYNLVGLWYVVVVAVRFVVVDEKAIFDSFVQVIAEVNSLQMIVNRQRMEEIVPFSEVEPIHDYWQTCCKCIVCELVSILIRISKQLLYVRSLKLVRVHDTKQSFLHVG